METSVAGFSGRTWQQRAFKLARRGVQHRRAGPAARRLQCLHSRGAFGDKEEGQWTRSDWNLCSSSNEQQRQHDAQPPLAPQPDAPDVPTSSGRSHEEQGERNLFVQWPANLPAGGYHPLEFYPTSQLGLEWGSPSSSSASTGKFTNVDKDSSTSKDHGKIFVILFGVGSSDTEGIYSLRAVEQDDGLPVDTIVAFENEDDALRYSTLLEATMDHEPTVWPIEWGELLEFCNSAGYRCRLEPRGSLLIPPDYNVGMTDWEKSLRLRRGEFQVLETEPALSADRHLLADAAMYLEDMFAREPHVPLQQHLDSNVVDSQLADPEQLELLKQSLERLLPRE